MATDFTSLTAAALVRLLNGTRLGRVITERQLYRHRMAAGLRIGDQNHIHLLRYATWLAGQLAAKEGPEPMAKAGKPHPDAAGPSKQAAQYDQHRKRAAKRQADIAAEGQEIGPPPAVVDPRRREGCRLDFKLFCETYFNAWDKDGKNRGFFYLAWSEDHLRAIRKLELAVLEGRLFAFAMPRGSGKTVLCLAAVLWAALYGHHKYICLIGATERMARKLLEKVYNALERNRLLFEDFPEVCHPIRKLERTPQRAQKQKCQGEYTYMLWTKREIVLPAVKLSGPADADNGTDPVQDKKFSAASGTIISVCGLTGGEVRGQNKDMPDGSLLRPSLVLLDDPQTKGSAKSPTQVQDRLELLQGDVLGMAGPDKNIAGMMPCTVIRPGDMADQTLDQEKHPEWHGERTKMVYAWPVAEALWEEYADVRSKGLRRGDGGAAGNAFYALHRAAMDAGAKVAWPDRFPPNCLSAIQHAVNLKLRDEAMFCAEYQNEPLVAKEDMEMLSVEQIAGKLNGRPEGSVPTTCGRLVMYIDVQKKALYYAVIALAPNFTGYVVEYGAYPDQKLHYFAYRNVRRTLATAHRGKGEEAAIYAGLEALTEQKLARTWARDDGASMRIGLCLIDNGYQKDTVELFIRQSRHAALLLSAKGFGVTAASIPMEERKGRKGDEVGENWRITVAQGASSLRMAMIDTNHWKSFLHARLAVPIGDAGCLSLWGKSDARHRMLAEHFTAEYWVRTEGRGRQVDEWQGHPGRDNHLLDCATGCMVAGALLGVRLLGKVLPVRRKIRSKVKAKYFK